MYGPPPQAGGYGQPGNYYQQSPPQPAGPIFTTGVVTVSYQAVTAPNINVPVMAISGSQSKRGMTGGQAALGVFGGVLILGGFAPWDRVLGTADVVGAAMPWVCWLGAIAVVVVGQVAIASPHVVTLTTPNGRFTLPPLTAQGAGAVLQAIRTAQGRPG